MSSDVIVHAKPTNNYAKVLSVAFLLSAAVVYLLSLFLPRYVGLVQLAAIVLLTVSVVFYTRYLAPKYSYEITTDGTGAALFAVRQTTGRRITNLSAIYLADVVSITRLDKAARQGKKLPEGYKRYVYTPTFLPEILTVLEVRSRYEKAYIYIEVTEELTAFLSSRIEEARDLRAQEEE